MDAKMISKKSRRSTRACMENWIKNLVPYKRSQVTIFIILAIVVVAIIFLILFLTLDRKSEGPSSGKNNLQNFMSTCLKDKILESVNLIETQGGYVDPLEQKHINFQFQNEPRVDIAYLCYYEGDYLPCVNQEPLLIQHLKNEIKNYISQDVEFCFDDLTTSLQDDGYVVNVRYREGDFDLELQENRVFLKVNAEITLTKTDESSTESDFRINTATNLYDLAVISQDVINEEVSECDFDIAEFIQLYSEYSVDKERTSDSSEIYTIKHKDSGEIFRFAVRGCVSPI